ncbi:HD-GYP domain-containing protein [Pelosinus sp. sgz500959]|uniref:HD-GYP domain-containing protein n=1 Tax=Pelosinus sp. sgz500959 TaxID=3242472 RepID=UPI003670DCC9
MVKIVAVKELIEGNITSDAVHSISGKVLLGKDTVLTSRHISLLDTWDIQSVFIHTDTEETDTSSLEIPPLSQPTEYLQFVQEYDSIVTDTAQSFDMIRKQMMIPVSHLKNTAGNIFSSVSNNKFEVMNHLLISDHKLADFIPRHSVMVAYFAGIIARQMKWNEDDISEVVFASLLHDIGSLATNKTTVPHAQANMSETGRLLRETKGLSSKVLLGIMQHRERSNGSGFPNGTPGSKIHPYAKIIAVADLFHNLAYNDEHANPFPILDVLTREMYINFDPDVCQHLIDRVRDSLLFNKIILSSGQEAEIVFFNRENYCSPIVRTEDGQIVDLSQRCDLKISRLSPCQ